ncbi:MAG: flagellar hook protein FlgE [Spirochaetales bacterium]|nr:flagellar hook protein FlgE [Spirochaetales bacterium]
MMRSLYSGVSGLQNHQVRMDVIGNNISNVNTNGFKKGRVTFQDMLSQTMSGAAKPTDDVGGINPKQVGLGMNVNSIDTIHTQGALQTTGVMTDIALQGNGFFILSEGEKTFYTRNGAFGLDQDGYLVNPANGLKVQGWMSQVDEQGNVVINTAGNREDLIIPVGSKDPAFATTDVRLACNLDKNAPQIGTEGQWQTSFDVYDSFGRTHRLEVRFQKDAAVANRWQATVVVDPQAAVDTNVIADVGAANGTNNTFLLDFDNNGVLQSVLDAQGDTLDTDALNVSVAFDVADADPDAGGGIYRQTFNLNLGTVGSPLDSITQYAENFSTKIREQNGYTMGYLETFKIDQSGVITGVYSNGANRALGQVALASFTNPGGLEKAGENNYVVSNNSGNAMVGTSGTEGRGKIIAGALEMSNVDLAEQFTDMIVTQRGFQANSKTITTSDQMLQELLTLKR